jgi:hypothetical protein
MLHFSIKVHFKYYLYFPVILDGQFTRNLMKCSAIHSVVKCMIVFNDGQELHLP